MSDAAWTWADLSPEQQQLLAEAEKSLGKDYLLAFAPGGGAPPPGDGPPVHGIKAAPLTDSELECLSGLETQLGTVVVAYTRSDG